jgi:hypothetical protein
LLNRYTVKSRIEGSNPSVSAIKALIPIVCKETYRQRARLPTSSPTTSIVRVAPLSRGSRCASPSRSPRLEPVATGSLHKGRLSYAIVRPMHPRSLIVPAILVLAGCATTTSDIGQVREVAPGTYKIGVSGGAGSVVFGSHEAADAAVAQAGQYCHAKGQKLVIVPTTARDVVFRCGEKTTPGE